MSENPNKKPQAKLMISMIAPVIALTADELSLRKNLPNRKSMRATIQAKNSWNAASLASGGFESGAKSKDSCIIEIIDATCADFVPRLNSPKLHRQCEWI